MCISLFELKIELTILALNDTNPIEAIHQDKTDRSQTKCEIHTMPQIETLIGQ